MYRVGGFPEYLPWQQALIDGVQETIRDTFSQFGYDHIQTPAVERNDILTKQSGEEISKEIFGLYRLWGTEEMQTIINQSDNWSSKKLADALAELDFLQDYGLHFDLTIPFARYVLDHQHNLSFPFKRRQMQPVWRGERQQKGRFKEFVQADIDTIRSGDSTRSYLYYDAETIVVLYKAFTDILRYLDIKTSLTVRLSNRQIISGLVAPYKEEQQFEIIHRIDKYYKMSQDSFVAGLKERTDVQLVDQFLQLRQLDSLTDNILTELCDHADYQQGVQELRTVTKHLQQLADGYEIDLNYQFDPAIVRGLDYYTGTVFETFLNDYLDYGSVCSGGRYENLTAQFNTNQNFSGVGGSIGLDRFMSWVFDNNHVVAADQPGEKILLVHFEETFDAIVQLAGELLDEDQAMSIYPEPDKLKKQFSYADKAGFRYVIILGKQEHEQGVYTRKDMRSGEEETHDLPW